MPNSSGRFTAIQCRKASVQLAHALRNWSSFILVENTTFIRYLWPEDNGFDNFETENNTEKDEKLSEKSESEAAEKIPNIRRGVGGCVWRDDCPPTSFIIVRLTSKPPCVVVWLAFPGGTCGRLRYKAVQALTRYVKKLTIKQLISWRGGDSVSHGVFTPSHSISSPDTTIGNCFASKNDMSGSAGDGWMENRACIVLDKPLEKILIRYHKTPKDFNNLLEPATRWGKDFTTQQQFNKLSESEGGALYQQQANNISEAELSLGTYLTLSRYFHCHRWIWSMQGNDGGICTERLPTSTINRIITTLLRARLKQGFHFAHSHQGIQTMAIELPTKLYSGKHEDRDKGTSPVGPASDLHTCVIQYVIFPPQIVHAENHIEREGSQSSNSSSEEDDNLFDSTMLEEGRGAMDHQIQLITELWVEPQDGIILDCPTTVWKEIRGKQFNEARALIHDQDHDIITSLATLHHLQMACQEQSDDNGVDTSGAVDKHTMEPIFGPQPANIFDNNGAELSTPKIQCSSTTSLSSVNPMPYHFNLASLLRKSRQLEILLSMFIQDLNTLLRRDVSNTPSTGPLFSPVDVADVFDGTLGMEQNEDAANELLYSDIVDHIGLLHDREICLTDHDNFNLISHFSNRDGLGPASRISSKADLRETIFQPSSGVATLADGSIKIMATPLHAKDSLGNYTTRYADGYNRMTVFPIVRSKYLFVCSQVMTAKIEVVQGEYQAHALLKGSTIRQYQEFLLA